MCCSLKKNEIQLVQLAQKFCCKLRKGQIVPCVVFQGCWISCFLRSLLHLLSEHRPCFLELSAAVCFHLPLFMACLQFCCAGVQWLMDGLEGGVLTACKCSPQLQRLTCIVRPSTGNSAGCSRQHTCHILVFSHSHGGEVRHCA